MILKSRNITQSRSGNVFSVKIVYTVKTEKPATANLVPNARKPAQ